MRRTRSSKPAIIRPPKRLRTTTPVATSSMNDRMMPTPGTYWPTSASGRQGGGNSTSDWSRMRDRKRMTQTVTMTGIQIRRPAIR